MDHKNYANNDLNTINNLNVVKITKLKIYIVLVLMWGHECFFQKANIFDEIYGDAVLKGSWSGVFESGWS